MKVEVQGLDVLMKRLSKLDEVTQAKDLEMALVAGALPICNRAKDLAPYKTGTLKRSIHVGGHARESAPDFTPSDVAGNYSDVGGNTSSKTSATVLIGTNLSYAKKNEYQNKAFLRPAMDEKGSEAGEIIAKALTKLIDQAAIS